MIKNNSIFKLFSNAANTAFSIQILWGKLCPHLLSYRGLYHESFIDKVYLTISPTPPSFIRNNANCISRGILSDSSLIICYIKHGNMSNLSIVWSEVACSWPQ